MYRGYKGGIYPGRMCKNGNLRQPLRMIKW
jgi:hypothetical protein